MYHAQSSEGAQEEYFDSPLVDKLTNYASFTSEAVQPLPSTQPSKLEQGSDSVGRVMARGAAKGVRKSFSIFRPSRSRDVDCVTA